MSQGPWFVRFAGRRSGPFDAERLRTLARRGALTRMHALSVDGRAWTPATSVRAVFNEDGSVVASGTASLEVEADEAPDDFAGIPDSGVIELPPSLPMRARLGSARVRPVVLCAMLLATVMLALPTSRDEAGAVAWWWHQGPISISVRGLAALAVLAGWVVAFLRPEPARAASVAGVAAVLSTRGAQHDPPRVVGGVPVVETPDRGRYLTVLHVATATDAGAAWQIEDAGPWRALAEARQRARTQPSDAARAAARSRVTELTAEVETATAGRAVVYVQDRPLGSDLDGPSAVDAALEGFRDRTGAAARAHRGAPRAGPRPRTYV
jgi:hypothetical protein